MKPFVPPLLLLAGLAAAGGAAFVLFAGTAPEASPPPQPSAAAEPTPGAAKPAVPHPDDLAKRFPAPSETPSRPAAPPAGPPPEQTAMAAAPRPSLPPSLGPVAPLQQGLSALAARRIDEARAARDALPSDSLDRHILAWATALYGGSAVPSADIAWAIENLSGWPGNATLRRNGERAAYREKRTDADAAKAFAGSEPQTIEGAITLARAQLAGGDREAARGTLAPLWRTSTPELREEMVVISEFGQVLGRDDHRARMEAMLYKERTRAALRVAALAGAQELAEAWSAVLQRRADAGKLLDAVPQSQRGAGYLFARAKHLRYNNDNTQAATTLLQAPADKAALVDPDAWWTERRLIARRLLDAGKTETAYRLAAGHAAASPVEAADAEFHAGWIALRFLKDPERASGHFARIAELGESAITLARAYYWQGRAAEAGAKGNADELYARAARYGTTFYGQLAAAKAGGAALSLAAPPFSDEDRRRFEEREAVRAIDRLTQAGYPQYAARLYTDLAQQLTSPGEFALLAAKAEAGGNHFLALRIGKLGMQRGIDVGALSHPVGAIPDAAQISGAGKALAYAVARQESEFNVGAVSSAGALGLLQLMPGTAKATAQRIGLDFSEPRLTSDAAYNATLGAEELDRQLRRFSGSYVLTFAAYNAGPRRAEQWIRRYGDPRGKPVEEVVDWIERVPFSETRSYIQRVLENYQVYKMRIAGQAEIERDLTQGRQAASR